MVSRVPVAPIVIGREREHADHPADPIVGVLALEERAVTAIVLHAEQAHQETGCGDTNQGSPPEAVPHRDPAGDPERGKRGAGQQDLQDAAGRAGAAIGLQNPREGGGVERRRVVVA